MGGSEFMAADCSPGTLARTLSLTVIGASLDTVDQEIRAVLSRIAPNRFRRVVGELCLNAIYEIDPPTGGAHLFKLVIYTPRQSMGNCVLVTNVTDGWNSLCHKIANEYKHFQFQVISSRPDVKYPQNFFEVWRSGVSTRAVICMRDSDKWVFFQKGKSEDFEETSFYEHRVKRARLTREIITGYLRKNGWNIDQPSFWEAATGGIYFEELRKK
jgi:hypothetical protein